MTEEHHLPEGVHAPQGVDPAALARCVAAAAERPRTTSLHQLERLAVIARLELADNLSAGVAATLQRVVEVVDRLLGDTGGVSIILHDPVDRSFTTSASTVPGQVSGHSAIRVRSGGATRFVVDSGCGLNVGDLAEDPFGANKMLSESAMRSYVGLPVIAKGRTIAVLYAMAAEPDRFDAEDIELLRVMADRAAMALVATQEHERVLRIARHSEALAMATRQVVSSLGGHSREEAVLGQLAMSVDFDLLVLEVGPGSDSRLESVVVGRSTALRRDLEAQGMPAMLDRFVPEGHGLRVAFDDLGLEGVALFAVRERSPLDDRDRDTLQTVASVLAIPFRAGL